MKGRSGLSRGGGGLGRHGTGVVALVSLGLVVALAGCAATASPRSGTQAAARVVAWSSLKPVPGAAPTPLAVPAGTPACQSEDLSARFTGVEGLTGGQMVGGFVFSDRASGPCELSGTPTVHLLSASGSEIQVRPGPDLLGNPPSAPVLLMPGLAVSATGGARPGQAWLDLTWPALDLTAGGTACSPPSDVAGSVVFTVPGGGIHLPVSASASGPHSGSIAPCDGVLGVSPFQAESPSPQRPLLDARLSAPNSVVAGRVLRYQVVLTNNSQVAVDFAKTCAAYSESLGGGAGRDSVKVVRQYELNCAAAGTLLPGDSIRFAMVLNTPKVTPHIRAVLSWGLGPWSEFAIGTIAISTVVKIT
ncbi:MAG: DUF4232 domain-containing protein [Candidatus Dormibacteria bacterium]